MDANVGTLWPLALREDGSWEGCNLVSTYHSRAHTHKYTIQIVSLQSRMDMFATEWRFSKVVEVQ